MRLIDADKLFLHFNDWALAVSPDDRHSFVPEYSEHKIHEMIYRTINEAMEAIEQAPAVDAVEVVRCKDCKHYYHDSLFACERCGKTLEKIKLNGFCNYGERRK